MRGTSMAEVSTEIPSSARLERSTGSPCEPAEEKTRPLGKDAWANETSAHELSKVSALAYLLYKLTM
jgi:hypothetical protein